MNLPVSPLGRRYGYKKDSLDIRDFGISRMKVSTPILLPPNFDLEKYCGPVKDQGSLGACTAFAGCGMREFLYRKYFPWEKDSKVKMVDLVLSPMFLYYKEREADGTLTQGDTGSEGRTSVAVLNSIGTCLETEDKYAPRLFQVPPTAEQIASAELYRAGAYHRVPNTVSDIKQCLFSGYVCVIGFSVYASFEGNEIAKTGLMPVPKIGIEQNLGGHEVLIIGYDDEVQCPGASKGAFKVRNSWGVNWGQKGNFWMPYELIPDPNVFMDAWMCHLGKAW